MTRRRGAAALVPLLAAACAGAPTAAVDLSTATWRDVVTGSKASLRGLAIGGDGSVWCSGSDGTVLASHDGGAHWQAVGPAGNATLDYRSLCAFDAGTALIASAGQPARVVRTDDGGRTWREVHADARPEAFFDGLAFVDRDHGWLLGDPVAGAWTLRATDDGGAHWRDLAPPAPQAGEAAFAASNSVLLAPAPGALLVASGGATSRLLRSQDGGATWSAGALPLRQGPESCGAFALAAGPVRASGRRLVAVGGDYRAPTAGDGVAAWSDDGGRTWHAASVPPAGYRCGAAFVPGTDVVVAVGDRGCSWSADGGDHWRELPGPGFFAVRAAADGTVWAVGSGGRVARLERATSRAASPGSP